MATYRFRDTYTGIAEYDIEADSEAAAIIMAQTMSNDAGIADAAGSDTALIAIDGTPVDTDTVTMAYHLRPGTQTGGTLHSIPREDAAVIARALRLIGYDLTPYSRLTGDPVHV